MVMGGHAVPAVEQVVPGARLTVRPVDAMSLNPIVSSLPPGRPSVPGQPFCAVTVRETVPVLPASRLRLATFEVIVTKGTPEVPVPPVEGVPLLSNVADIDVSGAGDGVPVSIAMHEPGTLCEPAQPL